MSDFPHDVQGRIRELRGQMGLTQSAFAQRLGVSFASVNRWENGQSQPNRLAWERIEALAREALPAAPPASAE